MRRLRGTVCNRRTIACNAGFPAFPRRVAAAARRLSPRGVTGAWRRGHTRVVLEPLTGSFGLGDIVVGCTLELSALVRFDLAPCPHVRAWLSRLQARPSSGDCSSGGKLKIWTAPKAGGDEAIIATQAAPLQSMVADDHHVYWNQSCDGSVWRVPVSGGTPEEIWPGDGYDAGGNLAMDDAFVYAVSIQANTLVAVPKQREPTGPERARDGQLRGRRDPGAGDAAPSPCRLSS